MASYCVKIAVFESVQVPAIAVGVARGACVGTGDGVAGGIGVNVAVGAAGVTVVDGCATSVRVAAMSAVAVGVATLVGAGGLVQPALRQSASNGIVASCKHEGLFWKMVIVESN